MICKYVSGAGEEFTLNENYEVNIESGNPYSTKWEVDANDSTHGSLPSTIKKQALNLDIVLKFRGTIDQMKTNMETFFRMCEKDILDFNNDRVTMGKLYVGEDYIKGWVIERQTTPREEWYGFSQEIKFIAPYPFWIHEEENEFYAVSLLDELSDLDYPHDYDYDYAHEPGSKTWVVDHYTDSDFRMIIYGAVTNPQIIVNGYPYEIYAELLDREYIVIDSSNKTVVKVDSVGQITNLFNYRAKANSIFKKMPSGTLYFNWDGSFGFKITLLIERSEPKWR